MFGLLWTCKSVRIPRWILDDRWNFSYIQVVLLRQNGSCTHVTVPEIFAFINAKKCHYTTLVKNFPKLITNQCSKQDIYLLAVSHSGKRQQGGPNGREQRCIRATPGVSCVFVCLPASVYLYLSVFLFIHLSICVCTSMYICMILAILTSLFSYCAYQDERAKSGNLLKIVPFFGTPLPPSSKLLLLSWISSFSYSSAVPSYLSPLRNFNYKIVIV